MLYTDWTRILSDNPENDFEELHKYVKQFKIPKRRVHRHMGRPFYYVKSNYAKKQMALDGVRVLKYKFLVTFLRHGRFPVKLRLYVDYRAYGRGSFLNSALRDIMAEDGDKSFDPSLCTKQGQKYKAIATFSPFKIDKTISYHLLIDDENPYGKAWKIVDGIQSDLTIPEVVMQRIEAKKEIVESFMNNNW